MIIQNSIDLKNAYIQYGPPSRFAFVDFLPDDKLIRELSDHFKIEFAVTFTNRNTGYHIYTGTKSSVSIPVSDVDILLKHSHPMGTAMPSKADHDWLELAQSMGSPQKKSVILPIGKPRISFDIYTPFLI